MTNLHPASRRASFRSGTALKFGLKLAVALGLACTAAQAHSANAPVVATAQGPVRGLSKHEVVQFLGIPYAAPPVGALRWRPPEKHAPWKRLRNATVFGPACAQITELGVFAGPANNNEDCLYLNVFAPKNAVSSSAKLPVLFWIHGGGYVDGESNDYDASKLAAQGGLVVVTINYRMNLLGFLAHPALDKEGHHFANYGLLDQQSALRWVKGNIAKFGGDPNNITVGGQSAGGSSTGMQLISPLTEGLFQRAIIESGASYLTASPLDAAEAKGVAFAVKAGCGAGADAATAACLRNLPVAAIETLSGVPSGNGPYIVNPIMDGQIVPIGAANAFASGRFHHMPIMNGSTEDEGNFFVATQEYFSGPPRRAITEDDVKALVNAVYGGLAGPGVTPPAYPADAPQRILQQYKLENYASPQLQDDAIQTDAMVCRIQHATELLTGKTPVYAYEFRDRTAPSYFPEMPDYKALAYHTADIQYLFPRWHGGDQGAMHELNAQQRKLSDELVKAWSNFARTGNPNGAGGVPWPAHVNDPRAPSYLAQDIPALSTRSDGDFTAEHKCDFWKTLLLYN